MFGAHQQAKATAITKPSGKGLRVCTGRNVGFGGPCGQPVRPLAMVSVGSFYLNPLCLAGFAPRVPRGNSMQMWRTHFGLLIRSVLAQTRIDLGYSLADGIVHIIL